MEDDCWEREVRFYGGNDCATDFATIRIARAARYVLGGETARVYSRIGRMAGLDKEDEGNWNRTVHGMCLF